MQLIDLILGHCASFDSNLGALHAYLLVFDDSIPDRCFSICLLGLLLKQCGGQFRYRGQAIQGLWSSCTLRS